MADRTVKVNLIADARQYIQGMDDAARKTKEASQTVEQQLQNQGRAFEQVGLAAAVAGGSIVAALGLTVKAAVDWESAWAGVMKTVDATPEGFAVLEGQLRDLAGVLPATHEEIAAVAEAAGQLGVSAENVPAFTKVMIDMGEATNLSADMAATTLARFMNIMGTSQSEVANLGSAIVELGNNYATTESEIAELAQRLAGAGRQVGFTEGEVLGLAAALSSVGIEAEAGGSALSKVMIDIASSVEEGGDRLGQFAEISGMSAQAFAEQWSNDPGTALSAFVEGLATAGERGQSTLGILQDLEITEVRMRDALLRAASASDIFSEAMQTGNEAYGEGNALADEAAKRYETLAAKADIAKNQVIDMAISFGEVLTPALATAVEAGGDMASFVGDLPEPMKIALVNIAALTGGVLLFGGTAMLAIPKIAEFKRAMEFLNITASGTAASINGAFAAIGAPALIAIGALTLTVGALLQESAKAKATQEEWNAALMEGVDAANMFRIANESWGRDFDLNARSFDAATGQMVDNLDKIPGYLDLMAARADNAWAALNPANIDLDNSGFASALGQIEDALVGLGDAAAQQESFSELASVIAPTREEAEKLLTVMPDLRDAFIEQATAAGVSVTATDGSIDSQKLLAFAFGETGSAADSAVEGIEGVGEASESAAEAVTEMFEAQQALVDGFFRAQDAMSSYEQTIDDIAEAMTGEDALVPALTEGAAGFDLTEQSGRDAAAMMADLVTSAQGASHAMLENGASAQDLALYQIDARNQIMEAARAMGLSEDAAREYADRLLAIPDAVTTDVQANVSAAEAAINGFIARNNNKSILINVNTTTPRDVALRPGQIGAYAAGGRIPGYSPGVDDRFGFTRNGNVVGLAGGEWVINTAMSSKYDDLLRQINAGTLPGYASGGRVGTSNNYGGNTYGGNTYDVHVTTQVYADGRMDANAIAQVASNRAVAKVASILGS